MPWAAWKASTIGMIVVVSALLPSQQPTWRGKPARSTSRPTMIWESTLLSLAVTDLAQVVLLLGLEVQGGHVIQTQGKVPTGGDVLEQGLRDRLAVAPLPAAPQGAEQGPHADRLQAQITQDTGHLGLRRRLDQTRQNHLLKGPITPSGVPQPQTGVDPVQDLPQQARALGLHRCAYQTGASRRTKTHTRPPAKVA